MRRDLDLPATPEDLRTIIDALPTMLGFWDRDQRNVFANRAFADLFGLDPDTISGRHVSQVLDAELYAESRDHIERALAGEPQCCKRIISDPAGEPRYLEISYLPVSSDGELSGFVSLVTDVTERKRVEEELRSSRTRLAEAEQVAEMGSWEYDIRHDRLTWSDGLFQIHGLTPKDFDATLVGAAEQQVVPEDRAFVRETVERAVAERGSFTMEYRALRPDGRVRTLRSRGEVVYGEEGEPIRIVGIARDITEERLAQEALNTTSADLERRALELQRLALRQAPDRRTTIRAPLSHRQLEILRLVAQGKTSAAIAKQLVISEGTVKWHVKHILAKTGSSSRAEAVARVLGGDS